MHHVFSCAGEEVIYAQDVMPFAQETLAEMRTQETRAAGDETSCSDWILQFILSLLETPEEEFDRPDAVRASETTWQILRLIQCQDDSDEFHGFRVRIQ